MPPSFIIRGASSPRRMEPSRADTIVPSFRKPDFSELAKNPYRQDIHAIQFRELGNDVCYSALNAWEGFVEAAWWAGRSPAAAAAAVNVRVAMASTLKFMPLVS